jgi:hypothetical protein
MARYHINPTTGTVGLCKAQKQCPFGDLETAHFNSKEAARQGYENLNSSIAKPLKKVKVFRNGGLLPAAYEGEILSWAEKADAVKPDDRAGRIGSLYGSPSLKGVSRWVRGNLSLGGPKSDVETYEITLDANSVYVYPIEAWEEFSWRRGSPEAYWDSGVLLKDYLQESDNYDDSQWEILFKEEDILSRRRVTKQRILENVEDDFWKSQTKLFLDRFKIK